jgi:hypothetical protein
MKLFTISLASTLFATVSFAQIPTSPATAPQPSLVSCSAAVANTFLGTWWSFITEGTRPGSGVLAQIGFFWVLPGNQIRGYRSTNIGGTMLETQGEFFGQIDPLCLYGSGALAGATLQLGGGLGGQILQGYFPISAALGPNGAYNYMVTGNSTLTLRNSGSIDRPGPTGTNGTNAYGYGGNTFATTGTAWRISPQIPCPNPAEFILQNAAPNGYTAGLGTKLSFIAVGVDRRGGSTTFGNLVRVGPPTATTPSYALAPGSREFPSADPGMLPQETGSYQVPPGCYEFSMNHPLYVIGGRIPGANFIGVPASTNWTRIAILPTNTPGPALVLNAIP